MIHRLYYMLQVSALEQRLDAAERANSQIKLSVEKTKTLEASKMEILTLKVSGPYDKLTYHFILSCKLLESDWLRETCFPVEIKATPFRVQWEALLDSR